jgi:hypothetical protein
MKPIYYKDFWGNRYVISHKSYLLDVNTYQLPKDVHEKFASKNPTLKNKTLYSSVDGLDIVVWSKRQINVSDDDF